MKMNAFRPMGLAQAHCTGLVFSEWKERGKQAKGRSRGLRASVCCSSTIISIGQSSHRFVLLHNHLRAVQTLSLHGVWTQTCLLHHTAFHPYIWNTVNLFFLSAQTGYLTENTHNNDKLHKTHLIVEAGESPGKSVCLFGVACLSFCCFLSVPSPHSADLQSYYFQDSPSSGINLR